MKKRVFAALLAAIMAIGVVGCGNQNEKSSEVITETVESQKESETASEVVVPEVKDPVTIHYWYRNGVGEQQYTADVEKVLNDMLKEMEGYEHISIDLHPTKNMATEFTLAQAEGAPIDLVAVYGLDTVSMISNGDFIAIDDLMAQYPDTISELPDWMVDFGKAFGEQYFIPAYQQAVTRNFVVIPDKYLNMYYAASGKTEADVRAILQGRDIDTVLNFWEEFIVAVRAASGKETKWLRPYETVTNWYNAGQLVSQSSSIYETENGEPIYWQYTEEYKKIMQRMNEWYQKGYIHPDHGTVDNKLFNGNNMLNDEAYVFESYSSCVDEEDVADIVASEIKCTTFWLTDHDFVISKYAAGGNAIYTECEHPEEAMMIIELLMTDKGEEFYNTFVWGLEGTHWQWEDEASKRIKTLEYDGSQGGSTSTYHAWKWNVGNTFNAWNNQAVADDFNDWLEEIHEAPTTVSSRLIGATWDLSSVENQLSQCKAVGSEYKASTLITADDFEKVYNEYMNKLKTAGVEDIIKVIKEIYDAHLAAN